MWLAVPLTGAKPSRFEDLVILGQTKTLGIPIRHLKKSCRRVIQSIWLHLTFATWQVIAGAYVAKSITNNLPEAFSKLSCLRRI